MHWATRPGRSIGAADNEIGLSWGPTYAEPGVANKTQPRGRDIEKLVVSITHADGFSLGTNFINVDILKSGDQDPANNSNEGATELYAVLRNVMSGNKITGTTNFSWGPIADIGWETLVPISKRKTPRSPRKSGSSSLARNFRW